MGFFDAIAAGALEQDLEIEGCWYRIRRITTADLLDQGAGVLLTVRRTEARAKAAAARLAAMGAAPASGQELAEQELREVRGLTADALAQQVRLNEVMVCAGLVAGSMDGTEWEPVTFVLERTAENQALRRLHVSRLSPSVVAALSRAVTDFSRGGEAAQTRADSLQRPPAARAGRGRTKVRSHAP